MDSGMRIFADGGRIQTSAIGQEVRQLKVLAFRWKDVSFRIRAVATDADKQAMILQFPERTREASAVIAYTWVIERFVISWEGVTDATGKTLPWSIEALQQIPCDDQQDALSALGYFILTHVEGFATITEKAGTAP